MLIDTEVQDLTPIAEFSGEISRDRQAVSIAFRVPDYTDKLYVRIRLGEGDSRLAFQFHDPIRSRGYFVPWLARADEKQFDLALDKEQASKGLRKGAIVAGMWKLHVAGLPVRNSTSFTVHLFRPARTPANAHPWFAGDLHSHSDHSDGKHDVSTLCRLAGEKGLQFLCLTDHNTVSGLDEIEQLSQERELLVLRGMEFTTIGLGHANAIGLLGSVDCYVDGTARTFSQVAYETKVQEALFSINHPFGIYHPWKDWNMDFSLVDCMEIWNNFGDLEQTGEEEAALGKWDELLNQGWEITGIGGSDAVHHNRPAEHALGNPTTYVRAEALTRDDLLKGIKEGRVVVSSGGLLDVVVANDSESYTIGDRIAVGDSAEVTVQVRSPFDFPHTLQWIVNGKTAAAQRDNAHSFIEMPVRVAKKDWLRVQARDENGKLLAFANPVYFV